MIVTDTPFDSYEQLAGDLGVRGASPPPSRSYRSRVPLIHWNTSAPGRLVPDGDTAAFAQAVVDLLETPEAAQRLGQNARQYSRDHFSWSHAAEQLESVYQQVLGARSSSDLPCTPLPGTAGIPV
jgi:glycosyltransferase involved in cell wall biosynthesis